MLGRAGGTLWRTEISHTIRGGRCGGRQSICVWTVIGLYRAAAVGLTVELEAGARRRNVRRIALVAVVLAVAAQSCTTDSSQPTPTTTATNTTVGLLTNSERDWCKANMSAVVDTAEELGGGLHPSFSRWISQESRRACKAAYVAR